MAEAAGVGGRPAFRGLWASAATSAALALPVVASRALQRMIKALAPGQQIRKKESSTVSTVRSCLLIYTIGKKFKYLRDEKKDPICQHFHSKKQWCMTGFGILMVVHTHQT